MTDRILNYTKDEPRPILSPPDTLQYEIERALSLVPQGINRFASMTLRCSMEHGDTVRWHASLEWHGGGPSVDEVRSYATSAMTAAVAVERLAEVLALSPSNLSGNADG